MGSPFPVVGPGEAGRGGITDGDEEVGWKRRGRRRAAQGQGKGRGRSAQSLDAGADLAAAELFRLTSRLRFHGEGGL
jgi:hypothetical protein